jgi:hypothetical protein
VSQSSKLLPRWRCATAMVTLSPSNRIILDSSGLTLALDYRTSRTNLKRVVAEPVMVAPGRLCCKTPVEIAGEQ